MNAGETSKLIPELRIALSVIFVAALLLIVVVVGGIVKWYTPPDFKVTQKSKEGVHSLLIAPNHVVHSMGTISVFTADQVEIAAREGTPNELQGVQTLQLPATINQGDELTIKCDLIYDRPMPCLQTVEKKIVISN